MTGVSVSGTEIALTVTSTVQNSAELTVSYARDELNPIEDENGNDIVSITNAREILVVNDVSAPTVTKVYAPQTDTFNPALVQVIDDVIPIHVVFSETVNVTGTPTLKLETGGTDAVVNFTELATTTNENDTLVFNFTVGNNDATHVTSALATHATTPLADVGTIVDNLGTAADRSLTDLASADTLVGSDTIVVDGSRPTIDATTNNALTSGAVANAGTKVITLTASETLTTITDADHLTALAGDFTALLNGNSKVIAGVEISGADIVLTLNDYIPNEGSNILTVSYARDELNPIEDENGNDIVSITNARSVTFVDDTTDPEIVSVSGPDGTYTVGDTIEISVLFTEMVIVEGVPELQFESDATATYASGSENSNKTLVFDYVIGAGEEADNLQYKSENSFLFVSQDAIVQDPAGNYAILTLPELSDANSLGGSSAIEIV